MDLRDSEEENADGPRADPADADEFVVDDPVEAEPAESPTAFVESVADRLRADPDAAANAVGDLLAIAHDETGPTRVAAGEALDAIGRRYPRGFEVWSDVLAEAAADADDEVAFFATRALAQLAAVNPRAAVKGRKAALDNLGAPHADLRQAALSVVAEVGPEEPDALGRADRPLTAALQDEHPGVRTAAAIAAGRLLAAAPSKFPRTATALVRAVDDEDDRVRRFVLLSLANFAGEHPSNVPEKQRVIAALAGADDDELDLRRGATGEALSALVSLTFEEDTATG